MKHRILFLPLLLFILCAPPWAAAHKVNVFAYAEGNTILGETSFSGGRPAKGADISVEDRATGAVLLRLQTDDQGAFSFVVPEAARQEMMDLRIVLLAGEGHRNEWVLSAEEYLPVTDAEALPPATPPADPTPRAEQSSVSHCCDEKQVRQVIEAAVGEQIAPLKHLLLQSRRSTPDLQDVLGGIGYIVGIFGIIAWMKARKGEKS